MGDFNEIVVLSEVAGGSFNLSCASAFIDMMYKCNLVDFSVVGGQFTWFRNYEGVLCAQTP